MGHCSRSRSWSRRVHRGPAIFFCLILAGWALGPGLDFRFVPRANAQETPASRQPRNPRDATVPLAERLSADPETRAREILYLFREYRVFSRDEEMAQGVRELHRIGPPAIPVLIAELDRADRENTLRALGIAARAMNDPRLIPALIRAIPRTLHPSASDCSVAIQEPELREFMLSFERPREGRQSVRVGRPVNEIHRAIEWITPYRSPEGDNDSLRHVTLGAPEVQPQQRQRYRERQQHMEAWWAEHGQEFLPEAELRRLAEPTPAATLAEGELDRVDRAGEVKFGPLFSTGADAALGPIHERELFSSTYADAPSALDLDRHRTFRMLEGAARGNGSHWDWMPKVGVDLVISASCNDIRLWVVDDERWNTIDEEVRRPGPLARGVVPRGGFFLLRGATTALFATREGGTGILQVSDRNKEAASTVVRYRMWKTPWQSEETPPDEPAQPPMPTDRTWGTPTYVTLESAEADSPRGWSVSRNERVPLPAEFDLTTVRREIWNAEPASAFAEWKTRNSIDFAMYVSAVGGVGVPDPDADPFRATLVLFDAQAREVRPDAFSTMSPARALELLDEPSAPDIAKVAAFTVNNLPQPQTHLFRRRSGEFGLLQIQEQNARTGVVRFRYKLATAPPDKEAGAN